MHWLSTRLRYSNVMSTLAVFIALGGASYAAVTLPKNSVGTKQLKKNAVTSSKVKNGSLLSKDFKAGQLPQGPKGDTGAPGVKGDTGAKGDKGDTGPSDAFSFFHAASVDLPNTTTPFSVSLPAGKYVIFGKLEVNNDSTIAARPSCTLDAAGDSDSALLGTSANSTNDDTAAATLTVAHTFAATGNVTLGCTDNGMAANGGGTVEKVKITAIRVGNLSNTGF
jgi:hypothetical protein